MSDWGAATDPGHDILPEPGSHDRPGIGSEWFLAGAAGAVVIAVLALLGGTPLNVIGYLAASLGVFTLVAFSRRSSISRSAQVGISPPRNVGLVGLALVAIGFALSLVHAWLIASYLA